MSTRVVDPKIQEILTETRHVDAVAKTFDSIETADQYRAAWEWAYAAAQIAYRAGYYEGLNDD
jgi:hypothetical protein